jgi:hypothetical protein
MSVRRGLAVIALAHALTGCGSTGPPAPPTNPPPTIPAERVIYAWQGEGDVPYPQASAISRTESKMPDQTEIRLDIENIKDKPAPPLATVFDTYPYSALCDTFIGSEYPNLSNDRCGTPTMLADYQFWYRQHQLPTEDLNRRLILYVTPTQFQTGQLGFVTGSTVIDTVTHQVTNEASFLFDNAIQLLVDPTPDPDLRTPNQITYTYHAMMHELGHQMAHLKHVSYAAPTYPTNYLHSLNDSTSGKCMMKTPLTFNDAVFGKLHFCKASAIDVDNTNNCRFRLRRVQGIE